jgi:hypothetical protein
MSEENCLHIVLTGAIGNALDAPNRFNQMSPLERTRIARDALARAGVVDLAPAGRSRAADAAPRRTRDALFGHICGPSGSTEEPTKDSATRAARLHRALDRVLDKRERRRKRRGADRHDENRVAADGTTAGMERAVAETVREGGRGFRAGDLADLQGAPRPIPVTPDLDHEGKMRERKANIAALSRQIIREGGPRPDSHGLAGNPPARAAYDARPLDHTGRPMGDLQYYRNAAAACSGGRS